MHSNTNTRTQLPVVAQRQVGHIVQPSKRLRADSTDLVARYEEIPGVPGDPGRDALQILGHALDGVRRLGALAARRAGRAHGAQERAQNQAGRHFQHGGQKEVEVRERRRSDEEEGAVEMNGPVSSSSASAHAASARLAARRLGVP